jgi:hypothetical protein
MEDILFMPGVLYTLVDWDACMHTLCKWRRSLLYLGISYLQLSVYGDGAKGGEVAAPLQGRQFRAEKKVLRNNFFSVIYIFRPGRQYPLFRHWVCMVTPWPKAPQWVYGPCVCRENEIYTLALCVVGGHKKRITPWGRYSNKKGYCCSWVGDKN